MPYYRSLDKKLHLGYRRLKGKAGTWWARHYLGNQQYDVEPIGIADDLSPADGIEILDYWQAQDKARARMGVRVADSTGKTGPLTVREAIEDYLQFLEDNRKSAQDARYKAAALILPELGDFEVAGLTTEQLERWRAGIARSPARIRTKSGEKQRYRGFARGDDQGRRRQSTANRTFTILKAALNRAWQQGKVPSDAAWRRLKPFEDVDTARVRYLTITEAIRLINAANPEFRPLVQAALQTGARYGELTRLQAHDFNLDVGTVMIRHSKRGKPRHVVLTDEGLALFKSLAAGRSGNELLFRKANGAPWDTSHQARPMIEACERAKINPRISFHGLRHTWASLAVMNGVPLLVVGKNLGHADTRMVEKHYGHLAPSYIADAIRAGAPRFGSSPTTG
jgi:integrase